MIDQSDEEINFYYHNHEGDLSDGSDNGGSGSSDNSDDDWESISDSSWHTSDSSDQTYSSDSGFSALEFDEPDSEMSDCIYRDAVGDPGDMFEPCEDCGALKLKPILHPIRSPGEISLKSLCCHGGKVDVEEESDPSPAAGFILDLWSRDDHVGYVFRKYARKINNAFSLASLYAKEEIPGRFNPSYKVRGKTYVRIGALMPGEQQERPAFSQIYIYDAEDDIERVEMRMGHLNLGPDVPQAERDLLRELFIVLQEKITACNPYVQQFKLAKDIDVEEELSLMFHPEVQTGGHARVYNAPSHELCVCAVNENTLPYPPIILRRSTTYLEDNPSVPELYSIHDCHPLYDIIRYLFFFPDGGEGWHRGRKRKDGKKMTLHQYYKFILHERPENYGRKTGNYILQGQKLMMEFVVMAFLREQTQRLRWMRINQKKIRAEMYKTLCENIQGDESYGISHGRKVILPASHYGSVRWYQKKN